MPCVVDVAAEVKSDILDCDETVKREVYDFLLALQEFPLPEGRHESMSVGSYSYQLPCGYFVSWELIGSREALTRMIFNRDMRGVTVRVLGFGR